MSEIFRPIFNYESLYKISDSGSIVAIYDGSGNGAYKSGRRLNPSIARNGYFVVNLYRPELNVAGKQSRKQHYIHRLLIESFSHPIKVGLQVRHLDGNRLNNHISNLETGTQSDNERDKKNYGQFRRKKRHV